MRIFVNKIEVGWGVISVINVYLNKPRSLAYYPQKGRASCPSEIAATCTNLRIGRAIAQAVSRWLRTAEARVRARVWSSVTCGGQSGAGAGFLRVLRFPLPLFITSNSLSSQLSGQVQ
jgi:hypothetical protein